MPNAERGASERTPKAGAMWMIWLASALAPASIIAWLSVTNVVDMPYWDDWFNCSSILIEWHAGTLGLDDLLQPHNESRPLFPRLLFLALGEVSIAALVIALIALDSRRRPTVRFVAAALACVFATWSFSQGLVTWIAAAPAG